MDNGEACEANDRYLHVVPFTSVYFRHRGKINVWVVLFIICLAQKRTHEIIASFCSAFLLEDLQSLCV